MFVLEIGATRPGGSTGRANPVLTSIKLAASIAASNPYANNSRGTVFGRADNQPGSDLGAPQFGGTGDGSQSLGLA